MSKKEIGILIVVGIVVLLITFGSIFLLMNKKTDSKKEENKTELKVGNYTIKFGKYKGYSKEYDPDTESYKNDEVSIEITSSSIITLDISQSYRVDGKMIVTAGGVQYEVIGNNKLILLAGEGVELNYEG